jgi:metallo-beta-lactamase class B
VGINWVAAYVQETSAGLILIDSLYGSWVPPLLQNIRKLGLDPSDIRYVINTHGHFDHAGGSALLQKVYGARVVMAEQDWALAATKPDIPRFYMPVPERDIVGKDGDVIELGDTRVELLQTPGHTEGVLTLRYPVRDGDDTYTAVTLGGVGLNFSGVERTETYIDSYRRLQTMQDGVSVSLPNHAAMAGVLERGAALAQREPGEAHPFVDAAAYQASLVQFIANAEAKLEAERSGNAPDPLEALTNAVSDSE